MKCANHPAINAVAHCLSCNKPLCEECAMDQGDGTFQCLSCSFRLTVQQMSEKRDGKEISKQTKKLEEQARKKKRLHVMILTLVCLLVVLAAVKFLLRTPAAPQETEQFVPALDSSSFLLFINQAVRTYSADHGGTVPDRLEELLGQYLPPGKIGAQDLETLVYVRKSPSSYELKAKKPSSLHTPGLVFTEGGVWMGGKFEKD